MVRLRHKPNQFALGMICGISFMICLENAVSLVAAPDFPLVRFILSVWCCICRQFLDRNQEIINLLHTAIY